ncbi:MAG: FHA domain-containing protein [Phycisphaerales bacterium]|nr:FHA domain-containing protein [Phycisphaerales bacterium]
MAELQISTKDGSLVAHVGLDERRAVSIGRSERCDICLTASSISRRHALVYRFGEDWHIVDVGSSTGMFTEDGQQRHLKLTRDHWVRIGPAFLWFGDITRPGAKQLPVRKHQSSLHTTLRFVTLMGAHVRSIDLWPDEECMFIGRGKSCDIRLDDPNISRMHAVLVCEDDVWSIVDADSRTGVFVDGVRSARRRLLPGRLIRIGGLLAVVEPVKEGADSGASNLDEEGLPVLSDTAIEELSSFLPKKVRAVENDNAA